MIDINLIRNDIEKVVKSEKNRFKDPTNVYKVSELDQKWRKTLKELEETRAERNQNSKKMGEMVKSGKGAPPEELREQQKVLKNKISELEEKTKELVEERDHLLSQIGNIVNTKVPVAENEEGSKILSTHGSKRVFSFEPKGHEQLVEEYYYADIHRAARSAGSRFYYLLNDLVYLNQALIRLALDHLVEHEYIPIQTPFMLNREAISGSSELADFEETLYHIESKDYFLIATSEQSIASFHMDEVLPDEVLPLRYAGVSTCFRKEASAENQASSGLFRVHQFEKVEQFVFTRPEDSIEEHEKMLKITEGLMKKLGLHYQVVDIASGDLNDAASRKYDVEAWFPAQKRYRELVSCSNCDDFQARRLKIRYGLYGAEKWLTHTLNGTAIATERTICAIIENFQEEDGTVPLPEALHQYMNGRTVLRPSEKPPKRG
ncbi:MAG: serine--tRNA ligase [Candidatus Kariarchaeaceae archaeon]